MWTNTKKDLITGILNHGPDVLKHSVVDFLDQSIVDYNNRVEAEKLNYPSPISVDQILKKRNWMIPKEHLELDIESYLVQVCPEENYDRLVTELALFKSHDMMDVLCVMKYMVDTLRKHDVLWGVGRGSSVASYVLFLIGIHKIDSVKYELPIEEFFKEQ
jgi:DNA polymerase III alpha subunit